VTLCHSVSSGVFHVGLLQETRTIGLHLTSVNHPPPNELSPNSITHHRHHRKKLSTCTATSPSFPALITTLRDILSRDMDVKADLKNDLIDTGSV
jgi:hypothetical protein